MACGVARRAAGALLAQQCAGPLRTRAFLLPALRDAPCGSPGRGRAHRPAQRGHDQNEHSNVLRRDILRLPLPRAAALYGLASLLWEVPESGYRLDTLIGITPQTSRAALALVRSLGAKEHGTVPGLCWLHDARLNVPGVLTTFNREAVPQRAASL